MNAEVMAYDLVFSGVDSRYYRRDHHRRIDGGGESG